MRTYTKFILPVFIVLVLIFTSAQAQGIKPLIFLDEVDEEPIIGISFQYKDQNGSSDASGIIFLEFIPEESLHLSHVNYGHWTLGPAEVASALKEGKYYKKQIFVMLQPVSVISLKMQDAKDQQIHVSDEEKIHHDAGAVLNMNPLVSSIRKSGSFGFDPVIRGFKYDQLNVVVDGLQSASAACPNRMDPPTSQIALNRMNRVELLKGPHALRYGIGLGGTINFIREAPGFTDKNEMYGRVSSMFESNGAVWRNEGKLGWTGRKFDIGLLGSWSKGKAYKDGEGTLVPADFMRGTVGIFADVKLGASDQLEFSVNRNFARDVDFPTLGMDLRSDDTWMGNLKHIKTSTGKHMKRWTNAIYMSKVNHLMDNGLRDLIPRMMEVKTPAETQNMGGRTEGEWLFGQSKLYAGADFRIEKAEGVRERKFLMGPNTGKSIYDNAWQESQIVKAGLFGMYQFQFHKNFINFSGRLDLNQAKMLDPSAEFMEQSSIDGVDQFNPGISLGWQRELGKEFNFGLWIAKVRRSGSLTERFINYFPVGIDPYEMLGNPDLNPETNNQLDMVFGFTHEKLTMSISLFGAYLQDYITGEIVALPPRLPTSPGVRKFINIDDAVTTGFEFSLGQKLWSGWSQQIMMAYTYGQNLSANEALPEIAPLDLRYILSSSHFDDQLKTSLKWRLVTSQPRISESFGEKETPGFHLLDLESSYDLNSSWTFSGSIQNLLNETYYEHLNRPIGMMGVPLFGPGRNYTLLLRYSF
ncbi:TonB-dependent receptor [Cyclobacterium sp.]|uniref:TonB-dependent receptor domain-containing protein n=1 Tax=Cyclobacterium sp. TaxID=1966343 RepID=UPI0019B604F9|nr:TonB-dependent receptor [Cyclobacterium sp.]MBD3627562.1 TonB-dependent receptor [Cyclobacterium sp.]